MEIKCPECQHKNPSDSKFCKECGIQLLPSEEISPTKTIETPTEELTTGSTFAGRYQIIEELGKGGMGKVYKVIDTKIKEKVALKLLKPEIASDKKTIERFSNELKFARKIRHENVCQMYDLNEEEGIHYITMEHVDGEDLKGVIPGLDFLNSIKKGEKFDFKDKVIAIVGGGNVAMDSARSALRFGANNDEKMRIALITTPNNNDHLNKEIKNWDENKDFKKFRCIFVTGGISEKYINELQTINEQNDNVPNITII